MESDYLISLRELSFFLRIAPKARQDHAVAVDVLIKTLSSMQESYARYAETMFRHDFTSTDKEFKKMENREFPLLIVDLKYESFGASLAPDYISVNKYDPFMKGIAVRWKKDTFKNFKDDVLYADLASAEGRTRIKSKFTDEERRSIYGPILRSIHSLPDYNVIIKPSKNGREHLLRDFPEAIISDFLPPIVSVVAEAPKTRFVKGYLEVEESGDNVIHKKSIKKIIAATTIPMDSIPYYTDTIFVVGEIAINLNSTIEVEVSADEEGFHVIYPPLNIEAWGDTRDEAIEAFHFSFLSLYHSYALEADANLTEGAIQLKNDILALVKNEGGLVG